LTFSCCSPFVAFRTNASLRRFDMINVSYSAFDATEIGVFVVTIYSTTEILCDRFGACRRGRSGIYYDHATPVNSSGQRPKGWRGEVAGRLPPDPARPEPDLRRSQHTRKSGQCQHQTGHELFQTVTERDLTRFAYRVNIRVHQGLLRPMRKRRTDESTPSRSAYHLRGATGAGIVNVLSLHP